MATRCMPLRLLSVLPYDSWGSNLSFHWIRFMYLLPRGRGKRETKGIAQVDYNPLGRYYLLVLIALLLIATATLA